MKNENRLSVIIPGFKTPEEWWCRCVKSVLAAVGANDEIVCVDDGSPERPRFLYALAAKDSRIKVLFLEKNVGQAEARNIGMMSSAGEYVAFVDSDDEIADAQVYDKAILPLGEGKCDISVFGVRTIWCSERLHKVDVLPDCDYGHIQPADVKELKDCGLLYYPWNKIFRRSFLERNEIRFDKRGMPCEDVVFNVECIIKGARISTVDVVGMNYYRTWCTSLASYKPNCISGLRTCNHKWEEYKAAFPDGKKVFGGTPEFSREFLDKMEWDNMWRLRSPCGIGEKKRFLSAHPGFAKCGNVAFLLEQYCYWFLRRWFYVRPIRRWHIRRTYPNVRDC